MAKRDSTPSKNYFERFASWSSKATGSSYAFISALIIVIVWAATGPIFKYSETWQLVINTGTTIITFLMVFLIQKSQNKDSLATQLKLNELVASSEYASNRIVFIEGLTEDEMIVLSKYYQKLAHLAKSEENLNSSRSIDGAEEMHALKKRRRDVSSKTNSLQNKAHPRPQHKQPATKPVDKTKTTAAEGDKTETKPKPNNRRRRPPRKEPPKTSSATE